MKLNPKSFANAFAVFAVIFYVAFYLLNYVLPELFVFLFNAQFFGADLATLIPQMTIGGLIGMVIAAAVLCWISGYLIAFFYNKFNR